MTSKSAGNPLSLESEGERGGNLSTPTRGQQDDEGIPGVPGVATPSDADGDAHHWNEAIRRREEREARRCDEEARARALKESGGGGDGGGGDSDEDDFYSAFKIKRTRKSQPRVGDPDMDPEPSDDGNDIEEDDRPNLLWWLLAFGLVITCLQLLGGYFLVPQESVYFVYMSAALTILGTLAFCAFYALVKGHVRLRMPGLPSPLPYPQVIRPRKPYIILMILLSILVCGGIHTLQGSPTQRKITSFFSSNPGGSSTTGTCDENSARADTDTSGASSAEEPARVSLSPDKKGKDKEEGKFVCIIVSVYYYFIVVVYC